MAKTQLNRIKAGDLELHEKVVAINRVVKTTKGGRAFSFSALVVVGNGNGVVGHGLGKAKEVQEAITKGIDDAKKNLRDLELDMGHSSAYLLGFKKLQYLNSKAYLNINFEAIRMSQLPSYLMRNAGNWYVHGIMSEGYTNQNQIMGAGSGLGNNMQSIAISYNKGFNKIGFIYHHILQNPISLINVNLDNLGLRTFKWTDNAYGLQAAMRYKKLIFNTEIQYINSNNYQWEQGKSANNIYVLFNTTYLW